MQERRRYIRFIIEGSATLTPGDEPPRTIKADLADISSTGVGILARDALALGSSVTFELITNLWNEPVLGEGRVVYIKAMPKGAFRIGMDFAAVDKAALRGIINRLQAEACDQLKKKRTWQAW